MTAAIIPLKSYTPAERRPLARDKRAHVVHHDGGYGVRTDGGVTVPVGDYWLATRVAFAHNAANGFEPHPAELRDVGEVEVTP